MYTPDIYVALSKQCTKGEIRLYLAICNRADKEGICWPSIRQLAADLESDRCNVYKDRASLVKKGFISFDPDTHKIQVLAGFPRPGKTVVKPTTEGVVEPTTKNVVKSTTGNGSGVVKSTTGCGETYHTPVVESTTECGGIYHAHIQMEPAHEPAHMNQPIEPCSFSEQLQTPNSTNEILPISSAELFEDLVTTQHLKNSDTARQVFDYYRTRMNHPQAKFDPKRQRAVLARLKEGFTPDQLRAAIDGCAQSPWHQGGNPDGKFYDGISLICRDADHVEMFIKQGDNSNDGLPIQERAAPLSANGQRLIESFAGVARRAGWAAGENSGDDSGNPFLTRPALLR